MRASAAGSAGSMASPKRCGVRRGGRGSGEVRVLRTLVGHSAEADVLARFSHDAIDVKCACAGSAGRSQQSGTTGGRVVLHVKRPSGTGQVGRPQVLAEGEEDVVAREEAERRVDPVRDPELL